MAVIRAKRLWASAVPKWTSETLGESRAYNVYQVPAGKRAIIRTMTTTNAAAFVGGSEPYFEIRLIPWATGAVVFVHKEYMYERDIQGYVRWRYSYVWNAQLVLHEFDIIEFYNPVVDMMHFTGSGHELNALSGS